MENSRRKLLKALTIAGGSATVAQVPANWTRPVVESVLLPAHAQTTAASCEEASGANPREFLSPGVFSFVVPAGVTVVEIEARGADGGFGSSGDFGTGGVPGAGATVFAQAMPVTPCETLTVCVGEAGNDGAEGGGSGGASGCGFDGGEGGNSVADGGTLTGAGGGGGAASAVRRGATALLVAGGAGGGGGSGENAELSSQLGGGGCFEPAGGAPQGAGLDGANAVTLGTGGGGGGGGGVNGGAGGLPGTGGRGGTCGGTELDSVTPGTDGNGSDGYVVISWV